MLAVIIYQNLREFRLIHVSMPIYIGILFIIGIIFFFLKFDFSNKKYIVTIVLISLTLRLCSVMLVKTPISADYLLMYNAAKDMCTGDMSWMEQKFFSLWSYHIPFVYFEAIVLKVFGSDLALKLLNAVFAVCTNLFIYLLARTYTTCKIAFISAFLYSIYPAPILLSSVLTNQHISLFFFMFGIYCYLNKPSICCAIIAGISLFLGNLMRPEGIIIILTIVLHTISTLKYQLKDKHFTKAVLKPFIVIIIYVFLVQVSALLFKNTDAVPHGITNNCPEWKFVIGLDTDSNGLYNEKNAYILSIIDPKQRREETKKIINKSLTTCENIPLFLWRKSRVMWASLENASWMFFHIQKSEPVWSENGNYTYEKAINSVLYFDKILYLFVFVFSFISCIILWVTPISQSSKFYFFVILILLNYSAYLFIEIQTRYRYFIMPFFFILTAFVFEWIKNLRVRLLSGIPCMYDASGYSSGCATSFKAGKKRKY